MPVPVAERRLRLYTAASMRGAATTGGIFCTSSCRPATGTFEIQTPSSAARTCGVPHRNTQTLRMTHGIQARRSAAIATGGSETTAVAPCSVPPGAVAGIAVIGCAGCQTRRKSASVAIDTSAATISTSHGPWKFETRYCGIANETPATRIGGQTSIILRQPTNAVISQNGTMTEKNGSWRPTMPLSS